MKPAFRRQPLKTSDTGITSVSRHKIRFTDQQIDDTLHAKTVQTEIEWQRQGLVILAFARESFHGKVFVLEAVIIN